MKVNFEEKYPIITKRLKKEGIEHFVRGLGVEKIKARGGRARLINYYTTNYPSIPLRIKAKDPGKSLSMKSQWENVKKLAEARDIPIKEARKLLKKLKTGKNVRIMLTNTANGWQLIMEGWYENTDKENIYYKERLKAEGYSSMCYEEDFHECYDKAFEECKRSAQAGLGGSGWELVEVIKETWFRYYGRYNKE